MLKSTKLYIFFGLFLFTFVLVGNVYAQNPNANQNAVDRVNSRAADRVNSNSSLNSSDKASRGADRVQRLSENRLRVCEARQAQIQNRFSNLMNLGTKKHEIFETHVLRVSNYYDTNLAASDLNPEVIAALLADIEVKKSDVATALSAVRETGTTFSCNSDDPKGLADSFRTNMRDLIDANRAYKQSIRAYIVAVRDLAKEVKEAQVTEAQSTIDATQSAGVVSE